MRNKIKNNKIKAILVSILIILLIFIGAYYANERLNGIVASYEDNYMNASPSKCPYGYKTIIDVNTKETYCYNSETKEKQKLEDIEDKEVPHAGIYKCPEGSKKIVNVSTGEVYCHNSETGEDSSATPTTTSLANGFFCSDFTSSTLYKGYIKPAITLIQIIAPILVVAFGTKDMLMAVTASNEDKMKKAQKDFVKRIIIAVIIIFLPIIVRAIFNLIKISICGV